MPVPQPYADAGLTSAREPSESKFAKQLDDGRYAYSWYESAQDGGAADAVEDATGAGLTSHL